MSSAGDFFRHLFQQPHGSGDGTGTKDTEDAAAGSMAEYLAALKKREPRFWEGPLERTPLTGDDLAVIEAGLGYSLPGPYREFLQNGPVPVDLTVLVSFCGDSYANSWDQTYSRETDGYVDRPDGDIGPTVEFEWHNVPGKDGAEFLANLREEQKTPQDCPCFLEAGFLLLGNVYGYLTYLDLVNGGIVTIHEEGVYDMMLDDGVTWNSVNEVREYMENRRLYICKNFRNFLRFVCTGDYLDEDEAKFPTPEELERDYSW